jgi:hypothetical protein
MATRAGRRSYTIVEAVWTPAGRNPDRRRTQAGIAVWKRKRPGRMAFGALASFNAECSGLRLSAGRPRGSRCRPY